MPLSHLILFLTAVEIHGHEKPIVVGLTEDIHCSTYLNATEMEWFLVGVDEPLEKSYGRHLTLTIDAKTTSLNGAMFTCRVTDVDGDQYEQSVTITVKGLFFKLALDPFPRNNSPIPDLHLKGVHVLPLMACMVP